MSKADVSVGEDTSVLWLGGLSGLLAGIALILFPVGIALTGGAGSTEFLLMKIQEFGRVYLIVPGLGMVAFLLSVPLFLALHRTSRMGSPAAALIGGVLGVSGALFASASWAITMAGFPVLSDFWAASAGPERETILVVAQAIELGVTHTLTGFGVLLIGLGFASLGWGLNANLDISKGYGWTSVVLGLLIALSMTIALVLNESGFEGLFVGLGLILPIALFLLLGWKVFSMSRGTAT